ncbi:MAG TPA: adenylosuccinate lyase [Acidobacteriota bacterium]|nr:adenylosuccinate lyase [Acidobacteriota bacterium]
MISRYSRPEMAEVWSDENKFRTWLRVELAVSQVLAERGEIPRKAYEELQSKAAFNLDRIAEIESEVRHDVIAFTMAVAESVGEASRYLHLGLTSTDVVDTAQALLVRQASDLIEAEMRRLMETLRRQAFRYRDAIMIGRTHGIHAEPTSLGVKMAVWHAEMQRNLDRFRQARQRLEVGKISGPVGTFSHLPPAVEEEACRRLGIGFARASTQTLQRDRHAEYLCCLAIIGGTFDKIATEIRHLQRTEVGEVAESFHPGQRGSSAMPHKRNPITCEQISGLARVLRANAHVALENMPLWHERDISHSSAERVVLPDSTTLTHYLAGKLEQVLSGLVVHRERMRQNLELTGGLIYSSALLLDLVRRGALRESAYGWIQRNAMKVWNEGADFQSLLLCDSDIRRFLSEEDIRNRFRSDRPLEHIEEVFRRVFDSAHETEPSLS